MSTPISHLDIFTPTPSKDQVVAILFIAAAKFLSWVPHHDLNRWLRLAIKHYKGPLSFPQDALSMLPL